MRPALVVAVALAGTLALAAAPPTTAASARATVTTVVLPAMPNAVRPTSPDSAPLPDSLAFLREVSICPTRGCDTNRPLCSDDSIRVGLAGVFPNTCYSVRRVDLWYPPNVPVGPGVVIGPLVPWVRLIIDDGVGCIDACAQHTVPWTAHIDMAPAPPGSHVLNIAIIRVSCTDSVPPPPWALRPFPFEVADCTQIPPACLLPRWNRDYTQGDCDATIAAGESAQFTLKIASHVPLAGLQGGFWIDPTALRITDIKPIGNASNMQLTWTPTVRGARFVMFSDGGGNIPPTPGDGRDMPVLAVTVSAPAGTAIPPVTQMDFENLLGSDPEGHAVPPCPIVTLVYVPPIRICAGSGCDANHDSHTDVRDLVLMVNCLNSPSTCPTFFDCNGDSTSNIDDVLCCAWKILRVRPCGDGCDPGDSSRVEPGVRVSSGVPLVSGNEVRIPIHVDGADRIGAARLAMRFPDDRWSVVGLESDDRTWMTLAGAEQGEVVMGAIRTREEAGPNTLDLTLRLRSLGAAPGGGELGQLQADVSAIDGVKLVIPVSGPVRDLPGSTVEMSENRPDPFTSETRFTLSLPVAGPVDLGVFDLTGRRVATLHKGPLGAGVSEFVWKGSTDGGGRARSGVYFYRATTSGTAVTRRMVFLGGR